MVCTSCGSKNLSKFKGEVALQLAGPNAIEPTVFIWPQVFVCLACAVAQFSIPTAQARILAEGPTVGFWQALHDPRLRS
jgi:hypothetical protein